MSRAVVIDGRCFCRCHRGSLIAYAPDVRDPFEAAVACTSCINAHCPALLDRLPPPRKKLALDMDGYTYDPTGDTE